MHLSSSRTGWPSICFPSISVAARLNTFDAALVLSFAGQARNHIAGKHDHGGATERLHVDQLLIELGKQRIARGGIANAVLEPGSGVEGDAQPLASSDESE